MSGGDGSAGVGPPSSPRLFGTNGIRKVVGTELTPVFVTRAVSAFARWIDGAGPALIAHDYRTTSEGIARICAGTLQMNGVDVYELGAMPTPCFQFNMKALDAKAGLMVTASHNPVEFNGIKFVGPGGLEISPDAERQVEQIFAAGDSRYVSWDRAGRIRQESRGIERYVASIVAHVDRDRIRAAALRVVLDCGNGTSAAVSPLLLRSLGCRLTTLNANPDGSFPGHPSEPSEENLADLKKAVVAAGAVVGIAHDGDSDRITFIDETGRYVPGEVSLALFAREMLRRVPGATIATSITSSSAIDEVVRQGGGKLVVTRSGSLPVALALARNGAIFGGEENGHYYWPDHQNAADGPASSAQLLDLLVRSGRPLSEQIDELPHYVVVKEKVPLAPELREAVMETVREALTADADRVITLDGVKAFYSQGWVLVRPSGTEPICRIFAESRSAEASRALAGKGEALVEIGKAQAGGHRASLSSEPSEKSPVTTKA